jgi:hypothetical protein
VVKLLALSVCLRGGSWIGEKATQLLELSTRGGKGQYLPLPQWWLAETLRVGGKEGKHGRDGRMVICFGKGEGHRLVATRMDAYGYHGVECNEWCSHCFFLVIYQRKREVF